MQHLRQPGSRQVVGNLFARANRCMYKSRRVVNPKRETTGCQEKRLAAHGHGIKGAASRPAMGKGSDDYLRIGNVEETAAGLRWNMETPLQGMKDGTALPDASVLGVFVPSETTNIAPRPPDGGNPLARMRARVAVRSDKANVMAAMSLTTT